MKAPDSQIKITISKIINCEQSINSSSLSIVFISKNTGTIILTKNAKAFYLANQLIINANLKIQYSLDESIIILRMATTMGKGGQIILGQFTIDLEALKKKRNHLLPLGKGRGFLQIDQYISKNNRLAFNSKQQENDYGLNIYKKPSNIQKFIKDRQSFLDKYNHRSSSNENNQQVSKKFAQKVSHLLSQVKKAKGTFNNIQGDYQNFTDQTFRSDFNNNKNQSIRNSKSQVYINRYQKLHANSHSNNFRVEANSNDSDRDSNLSKRSSKSQKYVLFVNNLNLVPAQQFIQQERQRERRSRRVNNFQRNQDYY